MSAVALHPTFHRSPTAPATPAVRLTRRGRVVVTLLFLGIVLALFTALGPRVVAAGDRGAPVPTSTVVVGEGDTLWKIASGLADPGETRSMVRRIVELNSLSSVTIHSGQELAVPLR